MHYTRSIKQISSTFLPSPFSVKKKKKEDITINTLLQFPGNDTPRRQRIARRTKDPIPFPNSHCSDTRETVRRHRKSLQKGAARQCW